MNISDYWISSESLIKVNCYNSRTSDNIDVRLGPVTKPNRRNKTTSKRFGDGVMLANCDVIVFFQIMANLDQSGSRILEAQSVNLHFH